MLRPHPLNRKRGSETGASFFLLLRCHRTVDGRQDSLERSQIDVVGNTYTEDRLSRGIPQLNIGHRHGVRAVGNGVGLVVHKGEAVNLLSVDRIEESIDRAVAAALDPNILLAVIPQGTGKGNVGMTFLIGRGAGCVAGGGL